MARQSLRTPDILVIDRSALKPVEHAEHAEYVSARPEQRDRQKLLDLKGGDELLVNAWDRRRVFGAEDFLLP